jgi:hypothetical protein
MSPSPRGATLFGRDRKPRLVHLKSRLHAGAIVLTWDARGGRAVRWRVLRSARGFAEGPFDDTVVGSGQTLVSDKTRPGTRDDLGALVSPIATAFYTIFCEDERDAWRRQARLKLNTGEPALGPHAEGDFEAGDGGSLGSWDTFVPPPPEHGI